MKDKKYYTGLVIVIVIIYLVKRYFITAPEFIFIGAGAIVMYVWCKDVITGTGWFEKKKPVRPVAVTNIETISSAPVSAGEKRGYLQLMHELVHPSLHSRLETFINQLKTFDDSNDALEPLYSLSDFSYKEQIAFIFILDWKAAIEELAGVITFSLKQRYNKVIDLPAYTRWGDRASIAYDKVFKTYNDALKEHGFQLGFINTDADNYALLVFETTQQPRVKAAVQLMGFAYTEITV